MIRRSIFPTIMALLLSAVAVTAGAATKVSVLTAHAGEEIYQLEGHTGLRIVDDRIGDMTVNWGLFDFDSPNFVYRFVKGETDYMAGATYTNLFLSAYYHEGRKVVEQVLDLTPEQTERLIQLVSTNLLPENRVYRYNYVLDNCATRPLALIEAALCDTLTLGPSGLPAEATSSFRDAMRHYHANYPWYQFGIDLALGSGIDRPISNREVSFAPEALERMLDGATLPSGKPFVIQKNILIDNPPAPLPPTPWYLTPMFWSCLVAAAALILTVRQIRRGTAGTPARIFDTMLFGLFGLDGLVTAFLIFISVHEATSPNWLFLWVNPLCFLGAVCVWAKKGEKLLVCYQIVNFALLIALGVIFATGTQSPNPAFIPLIIADALRAAAYIVNYRSHRCLHAKTDRKPTASLR